MVNKPKPDPDKKRNEALKYADLGWRMLGAVLAGVGAGWLLDRQFPNCKPWFTLSLSMIGLLASMWLIIKEVSKKK